MMHLSVTGNHAALQEEKIFTFVPQFLLLNGLLSFIKKQVVNLVASDFNHLKILGSMLVMLKTTPVRIKYKCRY